MWSRDMDVFWIIYFLGLGSIALVVGDTAFAVFMFSGLGLYAGHLDRAQQREAILEASKRQ